MEILALQRGEDVKTLQAGLYHGLTASTAEDAIISAVMMGGDTDTLAAVTGAIAGARFGASALPTRWQTALEAADELTAITASLASSAITCPDAVRERVTTGLDES